MSGDSRARHERASAVVGDLSTAAHQEPTKLRKILTTWDNFVGWISVVEGAGICAWAAWQSHVRAWNREGCRVHRDVGLALKTKRVAVCSAAKSTWKGVDGSAGGGARAWLAARRGEIRPWMWPQLQFGEVGKEMAGLVCLGEELNSVL